MQPQGFAGGDTSKDLNLKLRVGLILAHATDLPRDASLLEIGCGGGKYLSALSDRFRRITGVEPDQTKLDNANEEARQSAISIVPGRAESLPFESTSFDACLMNEVLEHIEDQDRALEEVSRVLRPSGRFYLFAPNRTFPFETHGFNLTSGKRLSPWVPLLPYLPDGVAKRVGLRPWARNYWPGEIRALLKRHGFESVHHQFVPQTFENISGRQPKVARKLMWALRPAIRTLAALPGVGRFFGVSNFVVATKRRDAHSAG